MLHGNAFFTINHINELSVMCLKISKLKELSKGFDHN